MSFVQYNNGNSKNNICDIRSFNVESGRVVINDETYTVGEYEIIKKSDGSKRTVIGPINVMVNGDNVWEYSCYF